MRSPPDRKLIFHFLQQVVAASGIKKKKKKKKTGTCSVKVVSEREQFFFCWGGVGMGVGGGV